MWTLGQGQMCLEFLLLCLVVCGSPLSLPVVGREGCCSSPSGSVRVFTHSG